MLEIVGYVFFAFLSLQIVALGALVYESLDKKPRIKNHGYRSDYD